MLPLNLQFERKMTNHSLHVNIDKWIAENESSFVPPVCNKLMFFYQLNIMYVGGPNVRKDYHIEEGEELFYQVRGDMVLKVIENGKHKEVHIREGEMFLLPARIPHSPQRQANTVGLVVERRRLRSETDGLRYFVANSTDVLFERWFYCENLGTQLVPIIKEFMESKQHKTGKPDPAEPIKPAPYPLNTMNVMTPFCFREWVEKQKPALASGQPVDMFGAKFETETLLFGPGTSESSRRRTDGWIWQLEGSSNVFMNGKEYILSAVDCLLIFGETEYQWKRSQDCVALYVAQDPDRKRPY
ncbi:3-hydroxyanthranilate 3,4-dioxygenase isoform X2 [Ctenopharyngodon idella]|uniref:3-hydroxyanthranilate 3,4-dioxygenase isoform X2 n=1 Tax=Ctenopharyngodon idella TaxID=7959 RepID=UPI0022313A0E|nr:3-hydroxyanthranilate 3,4-dioxygenase isoform X2 [Ctenopharyngodon idella]XP_051773008.1 3-hydroxyanthranilate 3,4-dioxygenase isoform X2 [Ctenopharyngodon idella]